MSLLAKGRMDIGYEMHIFMLQVVVKTSLFQVLRKTQITGGQSVL